MAKKVVKKIIRKRAAASIPGRKGKRSRLPRIVLLACVVVACAGATAFGFRALESHVAGPQAPQTPMSVRVRLTDIPFWMPQSLGYRIAQALTPENMDFRDFKLTETVYARAAASPWVRQVQRVTKRNTDDPLVGVLEVSAEFRRPVAVVTCRDGRGVYVDEEGVRLPDEANRPQAPKFVATVADPASGSPRKIYFTSRAEVPASLSVNRCYYLTISGVGELPPTEGSLWKGEDLAAGLRLAKILYDRPYATQVSEIDVGNFGGRLHKGESHIRLIAQMKDREPTDIRFGRFALPGGDYEISTERKIEYLDKYVAQFGALAGHHRYIDLRLDSLAYSNN